MRIAVAALVAGVVLLVAPAAANGDASLTLSVIGPPAADPADQPPFDGGRSYQLSIPPSASKPPPGFRLSPIQVEAIADESVSGELSSDERQRVRTRIGSAGQAQWQVDFFDPEGHDVAEVVIDDRGGEAVESWTGAQVDT
ncbi:MAG: hypothetical protein ACJ8D4_25895, partial [Xanthobacteraceae bacterium]